MKYTVFSENGRSVSFDTDSGTLALGTAKEKFLECPWRDFLLFSSSKPWNFLPADIPVKAAVKDGTMILSGNGAKFVTETAFSFEGEILFANLRIEFAENSGCNFAAVALPVPDDSIVTMPGNLYNNNPSTAADRKVPRFPAEGGASLLLESSRLPIPGINAEFNGHFLSLFNASEPEYPHEWTLGFHRDEPGKTRMMLSSGALSFCGEKDVFYAGKLRVEASLRPYPEFKAGDSIAHRFALSWGETESRGHGFRDLASSGYLIFKPHPEPALPPEKVMDLKIAALHERRGIHGYWDVLPGNLYGCKPKYLYGWTGQSFRLALCDMRDAFKKGEKDGIDRAVECVRFFLEGSRTAVPGLRCNLFWPDTMRWEGEKDAQGRDIFSSRALGETWSDLARILLFCREHRIPEPAGALDALKEGLQFFLDHRLPDGVPPMMWFSDGTPASQELTGAGSSVLPAFFDLWQLTGETYWKNQAEIMLKSFWMIGGNDFHTPFSHATLDAACEDKESGIPFFNAALKAWKLTGKELYRKYAEVSGDWLLTWVCFTDLPLRPDSICAQHGFRTMGWPTVSIENQHLDVFFPAWEMYEFGRDAGIERFKTMGKVIFAAWSHGISQGGGDWMFQSPGRQCEQFFHTDWSFNFKGCLTHWADPLRFYLRSQGCTDENIEKLYFRGGANPWDVAWIIALVLDAGQDFESEK